MLPWDPERYLVPARRSGQLVVGAIAGSLGLLLLYLLLAALWNGHERGMLRILVLRYWGGALLVFGPLLLLGAVLTVLGARLLSGRPRPDGGLFGPATLRLASLLFLVVVGMIVAGGRLVPRDLADLGGLLAAGVACWILAARRQRGARARVRSSVDQPSDQASLARPYDQLD